MTACSDVLFLTLSNVRGGRSFGDYYVVPPEQNEHP